MEIFRKQTHENYSKYRIFYTVENIDQIMKKINFESNSSSSINSNKKIEELELKLNKMKNLFESNGFNFDKIDEILVTQSDDSSF